MDFTPQQRLRGETYQEGGGVMEWKTLLSAKRERESPHKQRSSDLRSEFE